MSGSEFKQLEVKLRQAGRSRVYPPTPPIARKVAMRLNQAAHPRLLRRRWAGAALAVLILVLTLILVPPARAAILEFIQVGVVRIFQAGPPPAPALQTPLTATPAATFLPSVLNLAGETTLSEAQSRVDFPILIPAYPSDLGRPDHVYLQDMGSPMLVLVWMDRAHPQGVRLSLDEIAPGSWALQKFKPRLVEETKVSGQQAVWAEGPYMLQITNLNYELKRLVEGRVLIWTQSGITYRLETDLALEEAVKIAESLQPLRSTEIPIPTDLDHAHALVQSLSEAGIAVLSVQHSVEGSLFQSANQAAWIKTDIGVADAVFFLDPAETEHIQVTPLQSQEMGRYLYKVQAPPPTMLQAVTIDAAYPLYFTVGRGMFIETNSAELDKALRPLPAEMNKASSPTSILFPSPTPTSTMTDVPNAATQTSRETFTLSGEQAQEIAVFMDFLRAYNNGRLDEALALLAEDVGVSDCDYQNIKVVTFQGKLQAADWLRQRISDHDRLEVSRIANENPDPGSGRHVIGVEYSRRTSLTLAKLGFGDGITPRLASKVIFTPEPALIQSFANGPYGGGPEPCRPGN